MYVYNELNQRYGRSSRKPLAVHGDITTPTAVVYTFCAFGAPTTNYDDSIRKLHGEVEKTTYNIAFASVRNGALARAVLCIYVVSSSCPVTE